MLEWPPGLLDPIAYERGKVSLLKDHPGVLFAAVLMVGALIVIPVLAALRLARGFRTALLLAIGFGLLSVWVGLTVAFYADLAAGGAIVLTTVVMLALAEVIGRIRDYMSARRGAETDD